MPQEAISSTRSSVKAHTSASVRSGEECAPPRPALAGRRMHSTGFLRAVAGFRFQIFVDLPQRRLRMVADPRRGATLAHHVPARLVLAVVMAAADREVVFGPNDLRAGLEAAGVLSVYSRCGLHTRAVTVFRDPLPEGFRHFVASMPAPV